MKKPLVFALFLVLACCMDRQGNGTGSDEARGLGLSAPEGFELSVFASGLDGPRFMAYSPSGILHVTLTREGRVVALPDSDGDWRSDRQIVVSEGLDNPHGIAFFEGRVYIAETDGVARYRQDQETLSLYEREVVLPGLPTKGGGHFTRTVVFSPRGEMFVSVGSSCNVCVEEDQRRAAVLRSAPDGGGAEVFASGLRNAVGLAFNPDTGELFATENGRDWLGDDLPPDEINVLRQGANYGWPYCYGQRIPDRGFGGEKGFCEATEPPVLEVQAHSAPLGLCFYTGDMFPESFRGRLFVAFHGSWNRSVPTGYKVVSVPMGGGRPSGPYEDFVTGWLGDFGKSGRPVDVLEDRQEGLLISDDYGGRIYRVSRRRG